VGFRKRWGGFNTHKPNREAELEELEEEKEQFQ